MYKMSGGSPLTARSVFLPTRNNSISSSNTYNNVSCSIVRPATAVRTVSIVSHGTTATTTTTAMVDSDHGSNNSATMRSSNSSSIAASGWPSSVPEADTASLWMMDQPRPLIAADNFDEDENDWIEQHHQQNYTPQQQELSGMDVYDEEVEYNSPTDTPATSCLDDLIAETSARWKQQLHDSLQQCSNNSSQSHFSFASPTATTTTTTSSVRRPMVLHADPSESPTARTMKKALQQQQQQAYDDDDDDLNRNILYEQEREIEFLKAQLTARQQQQHPIPAHIVLVDQDQCHHRSVQQPSSVMMMMDDELTADF